MYFCLILRVSHVGTVTTNVIYVKTSVISGKITAQLLRPEIGKTFLVRSNCCVVKLYHPKLWNIVFGFVVYLYLLPWNLGFAQPIKYSVNGKFGQSPYHILFGTK